jgi:hypothetical protein
VRVAIAIGPEGEARLPAAGAEAAGLGPGDAADLSAAPGVALLSRSGAGAWLAGSLAASSFGEVAQLVASSLRTGVLRLSLGGPAGRQHKSIHFREGRVVFAASGDPADRLGPVLARAGLVPEAALARCRPLVAPGRPLGQVLVEQGVLTAAQLYQGLALQVREIFLSAFQAPEGEFLFREGPLDERNEVRLPERTRDLILLGLKRADEAERAAAATAARPEPPAPEAPAATPAPEASPGRAFEAYRRLLRTVHGPLARASPAAAARLDTWFERLPPGQRAVFEGVRFGAGGEVDVGRVLANVTAGGVHRGAAARAKALESLESLLTFALFEARNLLPRAEADALWREVARIQVGG